MSSANLLDPIWTSYSTTVDSLKVTLRILEKGKNHLLNNTNFLYSPVDAAKQRVRDSQRDADNFVIVSLWAEFERKLLEYVQLEGKRLLRTPPTKFNTEVHKKVEDTIEYWRTDDMLDLFKSVVGGNLIGNAKNIKKYRDWIAHKNPRKGAPSNVPPQTAYKILSCIIGLIEQHANLTQAISPT